MGQKLSCFFRGICAAGTAGAVEMSEVRAAEILKLDNDCFQELFEYLPLEDLVSMGNTCKRIQQVAGYFFQQNYSMFGINKISGNKIVKYWSESRFIKIECFAAFIENIRVRPADLKYFSFNQSKFHRLKKINLGRMENTDMKMIIDRMKPTLSKLKALHMFSSDFDKFHDLISLCPNITRLNINHCWNALDWIHGKYPTLEYLKIVSTTFDKLPMFLEQNPNIRKLAIGINSFWVIRDALKKAENIKLDELAILIESTRTDYIEPDLLCDLLNEFHALGFFKRLHLYIGKKETTWSQRLVNRLDTINGLVKLKFQFCSDKVTLSELIDLEELSGFHMHAVSDLEMMATKLVNLKRINLVEAKIDHILPFIRHSVKMQKIQVENLAHGTHFSEDTGVIDLMALNREREQLLGAQKITLYVEEETYLATKWALGETDFGLIRLKREGTFDFDDDFDIIYRKNKSLVGRTRERRIFGIKFKTVNITE